MSTSTEILRLTTARDKIRTWLVALKLAPSTAKLDECATAVAAITNNGSVSANVKEGETYTIPRGYHDGTGTVSGVAGGGSYELQSKTVTPTKAAQQITPDSGYYGLSDVGVDPIPENYQDVSGVTATADDVLANKIIIGADGTQIAGKMANNGAISQTLSVSASTYTIPKGYHNGQGNVKIVTETKTATPTKSAQNIAPSTGKVLSKVTVAAIPQAYQDVSGVTATAADVLVDKVFVGSDGAHVEGSMANNGAIAGSIDGLTVTTFSIPAGFTSGGTVSLTTDIEEALAAI